MSKQGYIRVMQAAVNLIVILMVEAGKVPLNSAQKVGENIMKAITGGTGEKK
jgi:hypothetical protein